MAKQVTGHCHTLTVLSSTVGVAVVNYDDVYGNENGTVDEEDREEKAKKRRASVCIKWITSRRRLLQMADELHRASPVASLTGAQD